VFVDVITPTFQSILDRYEEEEEEEGDEKGRKEKVILMEMMMKVCEHVGDEIIVFV